MIFYNPSPVRKTPVAYDYGWERNPDWEPGWYFHEAGTNEPIGPFETARDAANAEIDAQEHAAAMQSLLLSES